jgi:hypothetical protein
MTILRSLTRLTAMLAAAWIGLRMLILAQSMPAHANHLSHPRLHKSPEYLRKNSRWADAFLHARHSIGRYSGQQTLLHQR